MSENPAAPRPAVAIPLYKTVLSAAEQVSLERSVEVLGRHPLFIVGPERLTEALRALCRRFGSRLQLKTFPDRFFAGIKGYNALMLSRDFYRDFPGHSHVLIAQTDALVIADELDAWCAGDYAYVGAPWFVGGSEPRQPLEFYGIGNGGFSLRRLADFERVLATPMRIPNFIKSRSCGSGGIVNAVRRLKHEWLFAYTVRPFFPTSNEDFFWGMLVPAACPSFRVPTFEVAMRFAFEAVPGTLYELNGRRLPFGCHAWERYEPAFWLEHLPFLQAVAGREP